MAKFHMERSYIEPFDDEDNCTILIHIKSGVDHIYAGKVELTGPKSWIHFNTAENGDLEINLSAGMEGNKWDHITREIIGEENE